MHAPHQLPRRVLGDDCDECVKRSNSIEGLASLDDGNLRKLSELASEQHAYGAGGMADRFGASNADMNAVENLRLAARIVYRSGISSDVAS